MRAVTRDRQPDPRSERIPGESDLELLSKVGQGNWRAVRVINYPISRMLEVAASWAKAIEGVEKPWLVWCVHPDWALIQQRLIETTGWTPIVGRDPRATEVPLSKKAISVDFNRGLDLPRLYPHFPLELAFAWVDRLAFWHSDLLVREGRMRSYAESFEALQDGECAATKPAFWLRTLLSAKQRRYWELLGCTTRGASRDQWDRGAGWWCNFHMHINCPSEQEREHRKRFYYDAGTGIWFWATKLNGKVQTIPEKEIKEGHFTKIGNPNFQRSIPQNQSATMRDMRGDLDRNIDLKRAATSLDLGHLLGAG